mgnify:CR=1 FL=1
MRKDLEEFIATTTPKLILELNRMSRECYANDTETRLVAMHDAVATMYAGLIASVFADHQAASTELKHELVCAMIQKLIKFIGIASQDALQLQFRIISTEETDG